MMFFNCKFSILESKFGHFVVHGSFHEGRTLHVLRNLWQLLESGLESLQVGILLQTGWHQTLVLVHKLIHHKVHEGEGVPGVPEKYFLVEQMFFSGKNIC